MGSLAIDHLASQLGLGVFAAMATRVERTIDVDAPIETVWDFIADPVARANAISVVDSFERRDGNDRAMRWYIKLPIPLLSSTVPVDTEEVERDPPRYVRFTGRSRVLEVVGEHELETRDSGTRLTSLFTVTGRLPGVESFFRHNLDRELDNLESALLEAIRQ